MGVWEGILCDDSRRMRVLFVVEEIHRLSLRDLVLIETVKNYSLFGINIDYLFYNRLRRFMTVSGHD